MNIGFFFNGRLYPPHAGGTVHAYQICSQLTKLGHRVATVFYDHEDPNLFIYRRTQLFKFLKEMDLLYIRIHGSFDKEMMTILKFLQGGRKPVVWEVNAPLEEGLERGRNPKVVAKENKTR